MVKKVVIQKQKAVRKNPENMTRDQYTVVLEDLRSQFHVFGEGLIGVHGKLDEHGQRLDSIDTKLDEHGQRLDSIDTKLDEHGQRLDSIDTKLDEHGQRLENIETRLTAVETDLAFVKEQLSIIRHNQVTRDEFHLLETRVARLERARQ